LWYHNAYPAIERHANFCADARLYAVRKWLQIVAHIHGRSQHTAAERSRLPAHQLQHTPLLESVCL
jgi:hypothetical protein